MTATASDRRDRLRAMLADLKMPGALEAVELVLNVQIAAAPSARYPSTARPAGVRSVSTRQPRPRLADSIRSPPPAAVPCLP